MTAHPPLLDLPSSHVRRPLQKLEMSSLLLTSAGKKRRGYQHEFSTPCPRHFADDTPVWSKRTSKYPQAYFLILENIKLPKGRNIFHSSISNLNSYMLFVQIVSEGSANKGQALICELFSHSVMSDSLQPHGLQHPRLPCPSPSPGACSNSCLLSWWCYPTISSSVVPFSCLQSLPASGSFPVNQFFTSGGQSIRSFSFSISPSNEYSRLTSFRIDCPDLLMSKGLSRVFSNITVQKHQFCGSQRLLCFNSHIHTRLLEKPQFWLCGPLLTK